MIWLYDKYDKETDHLPVGMRILTTTFNWVTTTQIYRVHHHLVVIIWYIYLEKNIFGNKCISWRSHSAKQRINDSPIENITLDSHLVPGKGSVLESFFPGISGTPNPSSHLFNDVIKRFHLYCAELEFLLTRFDFLTTGVVFSESQVVAVVEVWSHHGQTSLLEWE